MIVRKATKRDLERINHLSMCMHKYMGENIGVKLTRKELKGESYNEGDLKNHHIFVAVVDGEVVGFISFNKKIEEDEWFGKHFHMDHIVVDDKFRCKGIGKALFNAILEKAKRNKTNIKIDTLVTNLPAINFYEKLGFKPLETHMILDLQKRIRMKSKCSN